VRKGGGLRSQAFALAAGGLVRSSLVSLGTALGAGMSARLDGSIGSLELRAGLARASSSTYIPSETWEAALTLAALRAWDPGAVTLAGGIEAGGSAFRQRVGSEAAVHSYAPEFGPTALIEIPWGKRFCARGDVSLPFYVLPVEGVDGETLALTPGIRIGIGAGGYF
jgi:hypothetical protein